MAKEDGLRMSRDELESWVTLIIETTVLKHSEKCPVKERVRTLELSAAKMTGWMAGAGAVGGIVGAVLPWAVGFLKHL